MRGPESRRDRKHRRRSRRSRSPVVPLLFCGAVRAAMQRAKTSSMRFGSPLAAASPSAKLSKSSKFSSGRRSSGDWAIILLGPVELLLTAAGESTGVTPKARRNPSASHAPGCHWTWKLTEGFSPAATACSTSGAAQRRGARKRSREGVVSSSRAWGSSARTRPC